MSDNTTFEDAVTQTMHALQSLATGRICPERLLETASSLTTLEDRFSGLSDQTINGLCPRAETFFGNFNPLNRCDVLRKYEDLSLRVISVALTVGDHDPRFFETMFTHIPNNDRPLIEDFHGVKISWLCRSAVILLPDVSTVAQSGQVLNTLNKLYVESPRETNWIIDMSGLKQTNLSFLGALAGLQNEFLLQSRKISLVWLDSAVLTSRPLRTTFNDIFRLRLIGDHYFSIYA